MLTQSSNLQLTGSKRVVVAIVLVAAVAAAPLGRPSFAAAAPPMPKQVVSATGLGTARIVHHALGGLRPTTHISAPAASPATLSSLPSSVDLTAYDVPVGNQGPPGSCVTWAIDYALFGWYEHRLGLQQRLLNPMFTYSQVHLTTSVDGGGSNPNTVLSYLQNQGADTMSHYSHNAWDFLDKPSSAEVSSAAGYRISGYTPVLPNPLPTDVLTRAQDIEAALASGKPVAIGFTVRPGFESLSKTNYVDNDTTGASPGGHEVLAVAYNQSGLWIQNSWGTNWGYNGYAYLSWAVVEHDVYSAYTINGLATGADPSQVDVKENFAVQHTVSSSTAPVTFSWPANDPSRVGFDVFLKTDSGAFVQLNSTPQSAAQTTLNLAFGHTYQVRVRAVDSLYDSRTGYRGTDYTGDFYSATVTPSSSDDTAFSIASPWNRYPLTGTFGGTYVASKQSGASLTTTFTGRDVGLVAPTFASAGQATITCDGATPFVVNLNSASTTTGKVMTWCRWGQSGQHSMTVAVNGSAWVGIDAFTYLK